MVLASAQCIHFREDNVVESGTFWPMWLMCPVPWLALAPRFAILCAARGANVVVCLLLAGAFGGAGSV